MEVRTVIAIAVSLLLLVYWTMRDNKKAIKRKERAALLQGRKEGMEMERRNILGNFDSTESISQEDFLRVISVLRAGGFELVYNPRKQGYDVRKHKYDSVIEVQDIEI